MVSSSKSDQTSTTTTEDSRVVATDQAVAVGRGSTVNIATMDDAAFDVVESMAFSLAQVAGQSVNRAFDLAGEASASDAKEIVQKLIVVGIPSAVIIWALAKNWK